jgi:hypothetical protein
VDLERLAVRLRSRRGWESVDLGFALIREWWRPVYAGWLMTTVPLALAGIWFLGGTGLLLFWWLLPLGEVVVLFTLSRAAFGAVPSWRETLRAVPELWRRALLELLGRRLHPARILRLPVGQLEGLGGRERRLRASSLAIGENVSGQLPAAFLVFEIGLLMAAAAFLVMMTPSWVGVDWELLGDRFFSDALPRSAYIAFWLGAASIVLVLHPLYVGAGFAVYLNRRTELEGWDLEIAFRQLSRRIAALEGGEAAKRSRPATVSGGTLAAVLALSIAAVTIPQQALASPQDEPAGSSEPAAGAEPEAGPTPGAWHGDPERDPRKLAAEVLARPELQRERTVRRWRLRQDLLDRADSDRRAPPILGWIALFIARLSAPLLWVIAAVAVVLLLRAALKRLAEEPFPQRRTERAPERLLGLDLRPESLPDDIPGTAAELWRSGQSAAALSLLYRGALARLAGEGLKLRESFTEDDCLRSAQAALAPARVGFFGDLTRAWKLVAYAHRAPETSDAEHLWTGWGEHFGGAR